ncbi:ORF33 [Ectromelia virus WH]|nr:ORF33 [Ectromelia virus WH]
MTLAHNSRTNVVIYTNSDFGCKVPNTGNLVEEDTPCSCILSNTREIRYKRVRLICKPSYTKYVTIVLCNQ